MSEAINELDDWADGGLTIKKACDFSGAGRTTIYGWMSAGLIAHKKHGTRVIIAKRSLVRRLSEGSPSRSAHVPGDIREA